MIDVEVNHSNLFSAARHQGYVRGTCSAFAASDLNAVVNAADDLSVDYLCHFAAKHSPTWKPGCGFTVTAMLAAVKAPGQPLESSYPYDPTDNDRPLKPVPAGLSPLHASDARGRYLDPHEVIQRVRQGTPVGVVIGVSQSLYGPQDGLIGFDPMAIPDVYHALIGVGVGRHTGTGEAHVLFRNSWGTGWGDNGHAWMSKAHLEIHLQEGFVI